jgi:DNA-directed RNA polymerase specialized sigma subunit
MLLQAYEPLLVNRVRRVQSAHTDSRELMAAARQGLLKAAARFDLQRVMRGRDRLYALAENYIRNALRDVLTEVRTAARVSNWLH